MILVPLVSVLYVLSLLSFGVAAYYGFRLTKLTRRMRVMVMITNDGPASIVGGLVLVAISQVPNLMASVYNSPNLDFFAVTSLTLLLGSALMFAKGFHKIYAVYLNEKMKMEVNSVLSELVERETVKEEGEKTWWSRYR